MKLTSITINDTEYLVSESFGESFAQMCGAAAELTASAFPDAGLPIPVYMVGYDSLHPNASVIRCIKEYRLLTGCSLREAKNTFDRVRDVSGAHAKVPGARVKLGSFLYHEGSKVAERFREAGALIEFPSALELLAKEAP